MGICSGNKANGGKTQFKTRQHKIISVLESMQRVMLPILVFSFVFTLTVLATFVFASSTQQYNKIFLNPFYRETLTSSTNYTFNISVNPPDGIKSVISSIFSFNAQINGQTQSFTLWVDGKSCNNRNYTVATAFSTTGNVQFYFDCSNVITKAGNYTVTMRSSVNTGAIIGWLDLTYMNNPPSMGTGGTEYDVNTNARIFARLLDGNSRPINLASCNASVYFPNNTKLLNNQPLTLLEKGIYYYDFVTPNITGNYITIFDCTTPSIPFVQNYTLQGVTLQAGESDQYYEIDFGFDNTNNVTVNSARVEVKVTGSIAGSIIGVDFNSRRLGTLTGITPALGNYTLTQSDFYITDTQVLLLTREGTGTNTLWWTRLVVNYTWNNPQQVIRGQDEVHVSFRTTNCSNIIPQNNTDVLNAIKNMNNSMNSNFTSVLGNQQTIYNYQQGSNASLSNQLASTNSSLSAQIGNISAGSVNYTWFDVRFNNTFSNQTNIFNYLISMNSTMTNYYLALNSTMTTFHNTQVALLNAINTTVSTIYDWLQYKAVAVA